MLMNLIRIAVTSLVIVFITVQPARALVLFDEGGLLIDGVQLLQDASDPNSYYYVPTSPRVSLGPDGKPEMLFVKFVGDDSTTSAGLIHFLFTLDLAPQRVEAISEQLRSEVPGATLRGPVPLFLPDDTDGTDATP